MSTAAATVLSSKGSMTLLVQRDAAANTPALCCIEQQLISSAAVYRSGAGTALTEASNLYQVSRGNQLGPFCKAKLLTAALHQPAG